MNGAQLLATAGFAGIAAGTLWASLPPAALMSPDEAARVEASVTYAGCNDVRALGKAPLYAGQPGYRADMDGDGDGIACEPHP